VAFDEATWRQRFENPEVQVFVALASDTGAILSTTTIRGPFPSTDALARKVGSRGRDEGHTSSHTTLSSEEVRRPLMWDVNGVWTVPEARGRGVGQAVLGAARRFALERSAFQKSDCVMRVVAYETNQAARSFYCKAGFRECDDGNSNPGEIDYMMFLSRDSMLAQGG